MFDFDLNIEILLLMEELFGASLLSKSGNVLTGVLNEAKYVLVYFSASWCKPCQNFTPVLDMLYESLNSFDKDLEVVYVSRDNSEAEFNEYYSKMPWLAVPFNDEERRLALKERFAAKGIPALFLINHSGDIKKSDCVPDVKNKGPLCVSDWVSALNN